MSRLSLIALTCVLAVARGVALPTVLGVSNGRLASLASARLRGGEASMQDQGLRQKIPVTLLSGFLGAGKTTLLKHLLQNSEGVRVGVIVNDVAAVNIDAKLVNQGTGQDGLPGDFIELSNGCACCSAGDDLFGAIGELVSSAVTRGQYYDHIVFEASGVAEPKLLRAAFQEAAALGWPLMQAIKLESMITVVDATNFLELYASTEKVKERSDLGGEDLPEPPAWAAAAQPPAPTVVQLLIEQVETADVLVVNKVDGVDDSGLTYLTSALSQINGFAELLPTTYAKVAPSKLLMSDREAGVSMSNDVMDHQSSVDYAKWIQSQQDAAAATAPAAEAAATHEHSHDSGCSDPECTDASHEHSHAHSHEHSHDSKECTDASHEHSHDSATCTDPSHDHSHEHSHDSGSGCGDPECTDPTHDHSHSEDRQQTTAATRFGITTFVYSRRRPFIVERFEQLVGTLPFSVTDGASEQPAATGEGGAATPTADGPFKDVLRSKGFVWLANEQSVANYWSQAGRQLELSKMGRWWAAVDRASWPEAHIESIEADCEGQWGDRRQELVFIGANMPQDVICNALDTCLATDEEMQALAKPMADAAVAAK